MSSLNKVYSIAVDIKNGTIVMVTHNELPKLEKMLPIILEYKPYNLER